jgi:HEAT repeat protein
VLYGLAVNQQLDAINKIVALTNEGFADGSGTYAVEALANYTTRKALTYLNPLLFDHNEYVRLNAIDSIRRLADKSSIPYLILALRDPEKQEVVAYSAYATLYKLIPTLGRPVSLKSFYSDPEKYSKPIIEWWQAELNGEHIKVNDKISVPVIPQDPKQKLSYLQSMLFVSSTTTRKKAITLLDTLGNHNSIPYLLLALSDPDAEVSYRAYVILHKLIPISGPTISKMDFSLHRDAVLVSLDKWWRQELSVENVEISR